MLGALQNAGLAGRIRFIGFDSSDTLAQGLRDGHIDALVLQNPFGMGYIGVKVLVQHIRGGRIDRFIDTGVAVVTRENMHQPEIKERLQPNTDLPLK
jgi:ribose transport system substrate-binding protein